MTKRDQTKAPDGKGAVPTLAAERRTTALDPPLPLFRDRTLTDDTIARVRRDFPGWDIYALKAEFDLWLDGRAGCEPRDYQAAFYGFMRQHHEREGREQVFLKTR